MYESYRIRSSRRKVLDLPSDSPIPGVTMLAKKARKLVKPPKLCFQEAVTFGIAVSSEAGMPGSGEMRAGT
jgi:hypothetical protein